MEYKCNKCGLFKEETFFSKSSKKRGYQYSCKECVKTIQRKWCHSKNRQEYLSKYTNSEKYKETHRIKAAEYRKNNQQKYKARYMADNLREELIKKFCENCKTNKDLILHHPDYSKPLDVITLCLSCHMEVHHGRI